MELPVIQYRNHRVAYTVVAVFGLIDACLGGYWLIMDIASVFGWIFLVIGLIVTGRCGWMARSKSVVLELNHQGIQHKGRLYAWNTLRSYAIREETDEGGSFNYLVLYLNGSKDPLDIQLDWIDDMESVQAQMAVYATALQITFDGVVKKKT